MTDPFSLARVALRQEAAGKEVAAIALTGVCLQQCAKKGASPSASTLPLALSSQPFRAILPCGLARKEMLGHSNMRCPPC